MNKDWRFTYENALDEFSTFGFDKYSEASGAAARFYEHSNWEKIDLPHDFALSLKRSRKANTNAGAYPNSHYHKYNAENRSNAEDITNLVWYRKEFTPDPAWEGKRIFIEFEGIYRDAIVFVNGVYLDRHTCGYTTFALELTDHLVFGEINSIAVRVDSDQAEGWWYEGGGIYRNVNLYIGEDVYFKYHGITYSTSLDGTVDISAVLVNDTEMRGDRRVCAVLRDADGKSAAEGICDVTAEPFSEVRANISLHAAEPHLWSPADPYLYTLELSAGEERAALRVGIRTVVFDADRGFFLNGEPLKIRGACMHQDFGGVGVALTKNLTAYRLRRLKEMGVNAYRSAHHAPSPDVLDLCDELGLLVMSETRAFGTSPESIRQLTELIECDRTHPSVIIRALGNEEGSVQNDAWGARLMRKMTRIAKALDPTRPVTYGGNNGEKYNGANGAAEVRGVNYIQIGEDGWFDAYHRDHPEQPMIGTEEASYVLSRGGAVNDLANGQIDASGNVTMPWGSTPKGWVKFMETRPFFSGTFMWTGFDYRGEANPFYYTNAASSFGTIDLCGMEKPPFYYYRAWWTDEPTLKLAPHWNHTAGDVVSVSVFTNCEEISLYLNGRLLETRKVERFDAPLFEVPFEVGTLSVEGVRNGEVLHDELVTAQRPAELRCVSVLKAETEDDIAIYEIDAYDEDGRFCPTADEYAVLSIAGGKIIGVGNGDPACFEEERKMRSETYRDIPSFAVEGDTRPFYVPERAANVSRIHSDWLNVLPCRTGYEDDFRIVAQIVEDDLAPLQKVTYTAKLRAAEDYEFVEFERFGNQAEVCLNGEKLGDNHLCWGHHCKNYNRPYRFYCHFKEGENVLTVVSEHRDSDAPGMSGYVRLGKAEEAPWQVRLHYGRARVFVKTASADDVVLRAEIKD